MARFDSDNQPSQRRGRGKSERTKILEAMGRASESEDSFYDMLIVSAFNPEDSFAKSELLKRMAPLKKPTMPEVEFEFDEGAKPHVQASQIMKAAADGLIPPDIANTFVSSIASMMKIQEITDLEERLKALEAIKDEKA